MRLLFFSFVSICLAGCVLPRHRTSTRPAIRARQAVAVAEATQLAVPLESPPYASDFPVASELGFRIETEHSVFADVLQVGATPFRDNRELKLLFKSPILFGSISRRLRWMVRGLPPIPTLWLNFRNHLDGNRVMHANLTYPEEPGVQRQIGCPPIVEEGLCRIPLEQILRPARPAGAFQDTWLHLRFQAGQLEAIRLHIQTQGVLHE